LSYDDAEMSTGVYKKSHRKSRLSNPMTKVISYSETPRRNAGLDSQWRGLNFPRGRGALFGSLFDDVIPRHSRNVKHGGVVAQGHPGLVIAIYPTQHAISTGTVNGMQGN
jgi:hypothetical protein